MAPVRRAVYASSSEITARNVACPVAFADYLLRSATVMTSRDVYSPEEWRLLRELPFDVILAAVVADVDGPIGAVARETVAAARRLVAEGVDLSSYALISNLLADYAVEPVGEYNPEVKAGDDEARGEAIAVALARSEDAATLLESRGIPDEAVAYKRWVYDAAEAAVSATKTGGVLGVGGQRVSDAERHFLDRLADALSIAQGTEA